MLAYRYPIVAREGWPLIGLLAIVAFIVQIVLNSNVALPVWLIVLLGIYIYRDPARKVPAVPLGIVAPVDGRITEVATVQDSYLEREARQVTITMHLLGIYSARSPTEGKIMKQWHGSPACEKALETGDFAQWIQTDEADDVVMLVKQRSHVQAPRCYAQSGDRVGQGQRCGFVPLGAAVQVLVPANCRMNVKVGDHVRAGSDIIATLVH